MDGTSGQKTIRPTGLYQPKLDGRLPHTIEVLQVGGEDAVQVLFVDTEGSCRAVRGRLLPWREAGTFDGGAPAEAEVDLVRAAASGGLRLAALVNEVYAVAEGGLWIDGAARTTSAEITGLMRAGELAVARREGVIVGCVRVRRLDDCRGELGMLAVSPARRGTGVGRALLRFAEELSATRACG